MCTLKKALQIWILCMTLILLTKVMTNLISHAQNYATCQHLVLPCVDCYTTLCFQVSTLHATCVICYGTLCFHMSRPYTATCQLLCHPVLPRATTCKLLCYLVLPCVNTLCRHVGFMSPRISCMPHRASTC